jgi:hypothetical protein
VRLVSRALVQNVNLDEYEMAQQPVDARIIHLSLRMPGQDSLEDLQDAAPIFTGHSLKEASEEGIDRCAFTRPFAHLLERAP